MQNNVAKELFLTRIARQTNCIERLSSDNENIVFLGLAQINFIFVMLMPAPYRNRIAMRLLLSANTFFEFIEKSIARPGFEPKSFGSYLVALLGTTKGRFTPDRQRRTFSVK